MKLCKTTLLYNFISPGKEQGIEAPPSDHYKSYSVIPSFLRFQQALLTLSIFIYYVSCTYKFSWEEEEKVSS